MHWSWRNVSLPTAEVRVLPNRVSRRADGEPPLVISVAVHLLTNKTATFPQRRSGTTKGQAAIGETQCMQY